jgi:hypothetical protein
LYRKSVDAKKVAKLTYLDKAVVQREVVANGVLPALPSQDSKFILCCQYSSSDGIRGLWKDRQNSPPSGNVTNRIDSWENLTNMDTGTKQYIAHPVKHE